MISALGLAITLAACAPKAPSRSSSRPARVPPPADDLVYFIMVDRFNNGDPSNDAQIDPDDPQAFHGGDLQGVIDKLDYLQQLGVRTVWLSPIFQMRTQKINEWGAYHGYWVKDPTRIEPRFGDEDTLARLADALHERDMRLVLDMVYNHTDYDAPLRTEHPDWFHPAVDISDWEDPRQLVYQQVHGLPDLAQEQPEVAAYLRDVSIGWIDRAAVDGFRIDAVRHMPIDFLADLNHALDAHVGGDFWTLGEDFNGDPAQLAQTWRQGDFDAVFDFPLRYAMVDVFCKNKPVGRLAATLSADRLYAHPQALVTFLDNHDTPRITNECDGLPRRVDQALAFMFTARGTPALNQGTEALMLGENEPDNRASMAWDDLHPEGYQSPIPGFQQLRELQPSLREGISTVLHLDDTRFSYARVTPDEIAIILVNRSRQRFEQQLPDALWAHAKVVRILSVSPTDPVMLSTFKQPWDLTETRGWAFAQPGALEILFLRSDQPGGYQALYDQVAAPAQVTVSLQATAPLDAGDTLLAVGADPELGAWKPAHGLVFSDGQAQLQVPAGTVLRFKLVVQPADGEAPRWEEHDDRYLLVGEDGAQSVVTWGE